MENLQEELQNLNITELCFEKIQEYGNREYNYAMYGDFVVIMITSNDYLNGYINATKLCTYGGKKLNDFTRLEKTKELMKIVDQELITVIPAINNPSKFELKIAGSRENNLISGTYVHEDLILNIATWISNDFYFKCSKIIKNYLIKNYKEIILDVEEKIRIVNILLDEKNTSISNLEYRVCTEIDLLIKIFELNKNILSSDNE